MTNVIGAVLVALVIAKTTIFTPAEMAAFARLAKYGISGDFWTTTIRGIFAGWLIALMVWLMPAADAARVHIILILTYIVALGGFDHIIAGSVDVAYLAWMGGTSWGMFWGKFFLPTLIGNILGGTALVAFLNYAQVAAETVMDRLSGV